MFARWSNENPERLYRPQPFGGDLSEFATFAGYTIPTCVIGGNQFGTDLYHPLFRARVREVAFH